MYPGHATPPCQQPVEYGYSGQPATGTADWRPAGHNIGLARLLYPFLAGAVRDCHLQYGALDAGTRPRTHRARSFSPATKRCSATAFTCYLLMLIGGLAGIAVFEACSGVLLGAGLGLSSMVVSILFILPIPAAFFGAWFARTSEQPWLNSDVAVCRSAACWLA